MFTILGSKWPSNFNSTTIRIENDFLVLIGTEQVEKFFRLSKKISKFLKNQNS